MFVVIGKLLIDGTAVEQQKQKLWSIGNFLETCIFYFCLCDPGAHFFKYLISKYLFGIVYKCQRMASYN